MFFLDEMAWKFSTYVGRNSPGHLLTAYRLLLTKSSLNEITGRW
jgi:hypothetical protein